MSQFLTLANGDPDFQSYLDGSFSKTKRALPIESLNVKTHSEQVTFQILDVKDIRRPFWAIHWLQILKARNLLLVVFPIFLVYVHSQVRWSLFDPLTFAGSALGALFLMVAANLRNDYQDHLSGLDRIHAFGGSRAIQKGWVTARQMRNWAFVYLALGVCVSARTLVLYPQTDIIAGAAVLFAIFGMSTFSSGLKHRLWSEWMIFLMLGPLLTVGMQISSGAEINGEAVLLGGMTGWLAVFFLHLKNFEQLMIIDKAQFANTIWWLGFERAKLYLAFWGTAMVAGTLVYQSIFYGLIWFLVFAGLLLVLLIPYVRQLLSLQSPVGSGIKKATWLGRSMSLLVIGLFVAQSLWILWR
jgi:1,4-dihydroxy-2-naphthoate octaprenyltransferase